MSRRAVVGVVCIVASLLSACAGDKSTTDTTVRDSSTTQVAWLPCGDIECGRIDVPRVGSDVAGETIKVSVYRRISSKKKAPVLMFHGLADKALHADGLNGTWKWVEQDLTIVTVPGASHFVQQDASDLVSRTMRGWLSLRTAPAAVR